jgi:hypothetical protein
MTLELQATLLAKQLASVISADTIRLARKRGWNGLAPRQDEFDVRTWGSDTFSQKRDDDDSKLLE